ncbi:Retrovirus-related Pol polyprotein LINE-1 [Senna tora]|uniref:Retrovirus-related Pol polyprotein LINE-1 n=1 Tax=Senna tora TaxID=362788 RepID=A0A834WLE8_9FABA|nr:Retrovirus-related Pol polyprotein LINE-1 [Senna tora]
MERSSKKVMMHGGVDERSEMITDMDVAVVQDKNGGQTPAGFVSFRDKLAGNVPEYDAAMSVNESDEDTDSLSDLDESSDEEDHSSFDPCPKLKFSQEELDEWCRPWKMTLIVHLMGRTGDFLYAYQGGPWMVANHYLVVQRWRSNFCPKDVNEVTRIASWVRIPSLPLEFYNGKFARICVEINLKRQLVPQVEVRGRSYAVEYEGLHMVCFHCGRYGHTKDICLLRKEAEGKEKQQQVDLNNAPNDGEHESSGDDGLAPVPEQDAVREEANNGNDGMFGPWMMVTRPKRGKNQGSKRNGINFGGAKVKSVVTESTGGVNASKTRFDVLNNMGDQLENIKGLRNDEVFIQGWSTDPNERNLSKSINGKEVIEDRAPWKPDVLHNSPIIYEQAKMGEGSSKSYNFSNPVFDDGPIATVGPKVSSGSNGKFGRQQMLHHVSSGLPKQIVDRGEHYSSNQWTLGPLHQGTRTRANGGGTNLTANDSESTPVNDGQAITVAEHGVVASTADVAVKAAVSCMEVEEPVVAQF